MQTKLNARRAAGSIAGFRLQLLAVATLMSFVAGNARAQDSDVENSGVDGNPTANLDSSPQEDEKSTSESKRQSSDEGTVSFEFAGSRWRDVIEWLAEAGDLALHVDAMPTGSFTYRDSRSFTLNEAIDRLNLFLLPDGFTIVRSGRLLSVIDLNDDRSVKQLESIAKLVPAEEIPKLSDHDIVKCLLPLGELTTEEAVEELSGLNLMREPAVFSRTNQLLLIDTGAKIKLAKQVIDSFQSGTLDNGTVVKGFALKHVDAEDVLMVARPHLGLATGEMIGIDVSISADIKGESIFVTGVEDKVLLIENLINEIDQPDAAAVASGEAVLIAHEVNGGNVETVYNVLLTLLAKKEVRLSMDRTAGTVVALTTPEIQKEIAETVAKLEAEAPEFKVIPLQNIDPYFAISLLEQILDLDTGTDLMTEDSDGGSFRDRDDRRRSRSFSRPSAPPAPKPKIDADPGKRQLFVWARSYEIKQIEKIIAELDVGITSSKDTLRVLPLRGVTGERMLLTAVSFWKLKNPIFYFPNPEESRAVKEKTVFEEAEKSANQTTEDSEESDRVTGRLLKGEIDSKEAAIRCQMTSRGLLMQSEDIKALDELETLIQTVSGATASTPSPPVVYYLKYAKPAEALRMLAELLDGADYAQEEQSDTLVNGFVTGSSGSLFGSLVTSREGTLTLLAGSTTVVADVRLNRLIAQGTEEDLERIEAFLEIIDKDRSITDIETFGVSQIIELENVDAEEVAQSLRETYAGRVAGTTPSRGGRQQSRQPRQQPQPNQGRREGGGDGEDERGNDGREGNNRDNQQRGGNRGGNNNRAPSSEPKMTIAVHKPSNSLIITAPEQLFREVEALVKKIDQRSRQTVEIIRLPRNLSGELQRILTGKEPPPPLRPTGNSGQPPADGRANFGRNRPPR